MPENRSFLPGDPEPVDAPPPVPGGTYQVMWGAGLGWGACIAVAALLLGWWLA